MTTTTSGPRYTASGIRQAAAETPAPRTESAALASVESGEPVGLPTPGGMVRGVLGALAQPRPLAREAVRLGRDGARILRGTDEIAPSPRDKRFTDPAWSLHPVYRRLAQYYLAGIGAQDRLVEA